MSGPGDTAGAQPPDGFAELLPGEAACHRRVEDLLLGSFRRWGYDEVITPSCEHYHTLAGTCGEEAFKFVDHRGRILALRPDVTPSIARLAATRLAGVSPLRLCYRAQVFRSQQQEGWHEWGQAGAELVGPGGPGADGEILALALQSLQELGLDSFQAAVGHRGLLEALLEAAGLGHQGQARALDALRRRDLVTLKSLLGSGSLLGKLVAHPARWSAGQLLPELESQLGGGTALMEIHAIFAMLEAAGLSHRAYLDLGLVRGPAYYTGMVFDIYAPPVRRALGGGGRYDRLLQAFGSSRPATGFSFDVPALVQAVKEQCPLQAGGRDYYVVPVPGREQAAFACAVRLRRRGYTVELALDPSGVENALAWARDRGFARVLLVGNSENSEVVLASMSRPPGQGRPAGIH